jgi:hypothetical protein
LLNEIFHGANTRRKFVVISDETNVRVVLFHDGEEIVEGGGVGSGGHFEDFHVVHTHVFFVFHQLFRHHVSHYFFSFFFVDCEEIDRKKILMGIINL